MNKATVKNILFIVFSLSLTFTQNTISGYTDLYYAQKLNDGSIINLPFRMINVDLKHQNNDFEINSTFALEFHLRNNTDFLIDSSPKDFILDLRELYYVYYGNFFQLKIGKQINTWGFVDENSPLDIVSPYDYFYLFSNGIERKLGTLSSSMNLYIGPVSFTTYFSPFHNTSRLPIGESDLPIELPISPIDTEIIRFSGNEFEYGLNTRYTSSLGDIQLTYFNGYDRLFTFSGLNVFSPGGNESTVWLDLVFSYRKTQLFGFGITTFLGDITLKWDAGYFKTSDVEAIKDHPSSGLAFYDSLDYSYPMYEKSNYYQSNLQLQYELPFETNFLIQYFKYDTLTYSTNGLPDDTDGVNPNAPGLNSRRPDLLSDLSDLSPDKLFTPGLGSPTALLSKHSLSYSLQKSSFFIDDLKLTISGLIDISQYQYGLGSLTDIGLEYSILENLFIKMNLTQIIGNDKHPDNDNYQFNLMEDFSHFRTELKYFF